ncbi:MAG: glycosyltransferase family 4 protein [Candidatus Magasanikbacteria bacterium]|nr:glycosyltransferase family 4 protein [Candidatus Magasanikbacteria bacterium]
MRIAFIGQKGFPARYGGVERHAEELARELAASGHEVLLYARRWYTSPPAPNKTPPGIKIIFTPSLHTKHLDTITHTLTATIHALTQKPDVIHYHGVGPSLLSWLPRLLAPRARVIVTFHTIDRLHQKWGWFARGVLRLGELAACRFPHETIAVSRTLRNYCLTEYARPARYIPNGARLAETKTREEEEKSQILSAETLIRWQLEPNHYILFCARLVKHKGAHYLIKAWRALRQQYPELTRARKLVIVGDSVFTDRYRAALHELSAGEASIIFTGWVKPAELAALYANTLLLVHPSENEGMSLTVLEAMARGRAVLLSDIPEHQELVWDKRFLFTNGSVLNLTERLLSLLQHPEGLAEAGIKNRFLVSQRYRWSEIAAGTLRLYQANPPEARESLPRLKPA